MGTTEPHKFPIQISTKGSLIHQVRRRILPPDEVKHDALVPIAPAPLMRFVTAPAPDLADVSPSRILPAILYKVLQEEEAGG
ncbi:hypothetical protein DPMN_129567 [Dreissena polymorpha]|uniref:Uncharacterized protein n=1 Tax=Dreissena polymorpha TaxID=45954 RepID=A0A9D4H9B0_DREPO|nr:hypothetical protein DPMN_129567 [Dreissena polymorpha]